VQLLGRDYLKIYLEDHFAGATVGNELARRIADQNEGTAYGDVIARISAEIEEDREALREIMDQVGVDPNRIKVAGAWIGEKAGRLKLNGHLVSYSPQSRVVEIEGLELGVTGKLLLWRALKHVTELVAELPAPRLDELIARAERQRQELEDLRLAAVREAVAAADRA
jgi:hypothetical protein